MAIINSTGKSTLLKIVAGVEEPHSNVTIENFFKKKA